ncbi:ABC transporter substrate-binding protein [Gracilibacillus kekensis]|uniref:Cellobiose transport system substrate-binding protein n=1 Tax=Gracilibacillus kekensis TaxID=1027249 RepID=A0A1M7JZF2_9BACI|nr:ABC transporter substrate-binding protein [Gracilibacillus kekensis]SHM58378.1 cellobiose transport system substrate-binding protein [Gracilibacillus kekensis]
MGKKLLLLLTGIVLMFFLVACSEDDANSENESGNNELTLWAWPGFGLGELAEEYEEETGVHINIQEADYGDVHQNLITALASGSGAPDISAVDEGYLDRMKENQDQFHNLFDLGGEELEGVYLDSKWEQATNADQDFLIGVPTDVGPMVMAYREDIFEEAGLPTDPEEVAAEIDSWESYVEAGRQVMDETGKYMINRTSDLYLAILEQSEEQYFTPDEEFIGMESDQNLRAWDIASSAGDISINLERDTAEWGTALADDQIATVLLPPWMLQNVKNAAPDSAGKWNVTFMPEGSGNFGGSFLTIPKQSDQPQEAYDFASWVMAPEQQLRIFKNSGPFPSTPEVYDDPAIQELEDDFVNNNNLGQIYAEAAKEIVAGYKGTMHDPVSELFQDGLISIEDNDTPPEEAWDNVIDEVDRQLNR